ncbi:MAG: high-potential iron-sulfur protein [Thiohalocapsa sp.]
MSDQHMNKGRRGAVKTLLGGLASVPLMGLVSRAVAQVPPPPEGWEAFPQVDEATDPTAIALKYKHDAAQADRAAAARPGAPPEEQNCINCQFVQADSGDWRPCTLFPGKLVAANGWCSSWTIKAGG